MTDRELLQMALDALEAAYHPDTKAGKVMEAISARLAQPEPEPVAWVETLDNAQPHCVTDLKYCSVMQHDRGEHLKYTPLYTVPPQPEPTIDGWPLYSGLPAVFPSGGGNGQR